MSLGSKQQNHSHAIIIMRGRSITSNTHFYSLNWNVICIVFQTVPSILLKGQNTFLRKTLLCILCQYPWNENIPTGVTNSILDYLVLFVFFPSRVPDCSTILLQGKNIKFRFCLLTSAESNQLVTNFRQKLHVPSVRLLCFDRNIKK